MGGPINQEVVNLSVGGDNIYIMCGLYIYTWDSRRIAVLKIIIRILLAFHTACLLFIFFFSFFWGKKCTCYFVLSINVIVNQNLPSKQKKYYMYASTSNNRSTFNHYIL